MVPKRIEAIADAVCVKIGAREVSFVANGAFKYTFHARLNDGSSVALKVLKRSADARTDREVHALLRCNHPNIARLLDFDTIVVDAALEYFVVEEFLGGGSLDTHMVNGTPHDYAMVGRALADALTHIAERNLVHRDIKPANIMFRDDGLTPVMVDFGLVRMLGAESLTPTIAPFGPCTPLYAAPEQLRNEKARIDWRTDQFGLAVTLVQAMFGVHPYADSATTPNDIIISRMLGDLSWCSWVEEACTEKGMEQLLVMLQPDVTTRFASISTFREAWRLAPVVS